MFAGSRLRDALRAAENASDSLSSILFAAPTSDDIFSTCASVLACSNAGEIVASNSLLFSLNKLLCACAPDSAAFLF